MTAFSLRHSHDPLRPPEAPGLGRGIAFAVAIHIGLVVAISINVQWRTKTLPAFEAELWSAVPEAAAPKAEEPPPEPEVKPEPPQPKGPTAEELQAEREAEIAVAKAKEKKKREAEQEAERKKELALKAKAEKEKLDKKKQEAEDKLKQEKLDKLKAEKAEKAAEKAQEAKLEAQRKENIKRLMGMAGASGGANATGTALKSSGPSSSYGGRIVARVRPNIIYNESPVGNPMAEVEVRAAPDGTIIGKKLIKPSGDAEWDKAVLRAIDKTEILPRDVDGTVPSSIVISFRPRD